MKGKKTKTALNLNEHSDMQTALAHAYVLGIADQELGRNSPRTGRSILDLIARNMELDLVTHRVSHLRYLKSAYQAAKFNGSMRADADAFKRKGSRP